ncbi:MAG TPA: transposase [Sedimentisphaerales bacterium]|nr:transposase [Sedimentisphaerales bacterium]HNU28401.1 transposase [Sedimentisphaerales bacterium]
MSMSKRRLERQQNLWINTTEIVTSPGHPFYQRLNQLLQEHGFDRFVEDRCDSFYAPTRGRPSIPPGVYFRMLLIGYFEGIDSERGIAWRCADSLALRSFLGYELNERTPEHSSLSVIRGRIDVETHREVFQWVLKVLATSNLLKGKTIGIDATTLEANAALRSIVRRDTDQRYEEFLQDLAKASGIESPTREDLARIDRKRPKKGSNQDWYNPNDPDARITKMKDGRTHLAHKAEHAVDLETGAIVAVTLQGADQGDTTTMATTLSETEKNLAQVQGDPQAKEGLHPNGMQEVVADKGYHSNETVRTLQGQAIRSYVSEPRYRGRRHWKDREAERQAVYANRRRIHGERGKRLLRKRGELLERPFAHCYETGGMRRTHLRTHARILKRLLIHVAGCNLALVMRTVFGLGTPRGLQGLILGFLRRGIRLACELWRRGTPTRSSRWRLGSPSVVWPILRPELPAL